MLEFKLNHVSKEGSSCRGLCTNVTWLDYFLRHNNTYDWKIWIMDSEILCETGHTRIHAQTFVA